MIETLRAFVALNLELSAARRIIMLKRALRSTSDAYNHQIAWVSATNLHIAIRSFGQIDASLGPALGDGLREAIRGIGPIRLPLSGPLAFPDPTHARLLMIDASSAPGALRTLVERIEKLAESFGLPPDERLLCPHIMFGRAPAPFDARRMLSQLGRTESFDAFATECLLYSDFVDAPGAEYQAFARVQLVSTYPTKQQRPKPTRKSFAPPPLQQQRDMGKDQRRDPRYGQPPQQQQQQHRQTQAHDQQMEQQGPYEQPSQMLPIDPSVEPDSPSSADFQSQPDFTSRADFPAETDFPAQADFPTETDFLSQADFSSRAPEANSQVDNAVLIEPPACAMVDCFGEERRANPPVLD
ncbi:MAG: RNA 2',3'-cyclic phosphodiesterase [Polyangiaceae bacterium]|nr:RNA 2',3'-cyclic phosphodiesterase [Polyangiaceae bacterium]